MENGSSEILSTDRIAAQQSRREGQRKMSQKELLKCRIEEERKKLNLLVAQGSNAKVYAQSLLLDRLIEQYMELA